MAKTFTPKETQKALDKFGKMVVIRASAQLRLKKINYTGRLDDSLDYDLNVTKNSLNLDFLMEDYGVVVDKGRKPGKGAPPDKILEWVLKKPIRVRDSKGKFVNATMRQKEALAFAINRKIKEEGIKPTNFFSGQFDKYFEKLPRQLQEAYGLDVENFLKFTTKNTGFK